LWWACKARAGVLVGAAGDLPGQAVNLNLKF